MFEVNEWFDNLFWPTYPRDLCNRPGSKSMALTSAKSKVKSQDMADKVLAGLREQIRYYRKVKAKGGHGSEWKLGMVSTWLNQERWTDEIGSHHDLKVKYEAKLCRCGSETVIGKLCLPCYEKIAGNEDWRIKMCREYFVRNGLGQKHTESRQQWLTRLKVKAKHSAARIG